MRRASNNVAVFREHGNILLSFGYDYCAEHEWSTKPLQRMLGVSGDLTDLTIQRFAVTTANADNLFLIEGSVTTTDWSTARGKKTKHARLYRKRSGSGPG